MRESNHNLASQNRASIVISNALYDRRAFDSPISTLPLVSSLHHLSYLTSTSPRIREILAVDGGLERLVRIATAGIDMANAPGGAECTCQLSANLMPVDPPVASTSSGVCPCSTQRPRGPRFKAFSAYSKKASTASAPTAYDRILLMTYTLSLQSLVNVGVRGSEHIRTRVVQAGVLSLAVRVLKGFLVERARQATEIAEAQELAYRAARRTARMQAITLLAAPTLEDVPVVEIDIEPPLPPVTRTPTPDTVALIADDAAGSQEERDQDAQDAQDDADLECSAVAPEVARARSATIKTGASPASEVVHAVADDAMQVDGPESGESDGEPADTNSLQPPAAPRPDAGMPEEPTPRVEELLLPSRPFDDVPAVPLVDVMTPSSSSQGSVSTPMAFRFREDDVLLVLQLLAYLSKYAHVRSVFHDPERAYECIAPYQRDELDSMSAPPLQPPADSSRNVFALVERFTVRPSPNDRTTPRLPAELGYWSGVVMRNACRKDESRGGIRQCANNACGRYEEYPRQFAKCRRCRKAKYCSKACQSKAWSSGHRYWCSAKEPSEHHGHHHHGRVHDGSQSATPADASPARGNITLDDDDDETIEIAPRAHPRTHVLLRGTLPDVQDDLFITGPDINDPLRVANLDVDEARFF